jgi:hypothetical protein
MGAVAIIETFAGCLFLPSQYRGHQFNVWIKLNVAIWVEPDDVDEFTMAIEVCGFVQRGRFNDGKFYPKSHHYRLNSAKSVSTP